jgi:hypothetical protein
MLTQTLAHELNLAARFLPEDPDDDDTLPCVETGGVQVYAYWAANEGLCVSLHLDGGIPDGLTTDAGTVPVRITVEGHLVYAAT